jgi:hypothetical protein
MLFCSDVHWILVLFSGCHTVYLIDPVLTLNVTRIWHKIWPFASCVSNWRTYLAIFDTPYGTWATVQRQMLVCCMWNIVCHMCGWVGLQCRDRCWRAAYGTLFVTCVDEWGLQCRDRCWGAAYGTLFVTCVDEWVYSAETDAGVLHMEHCVPHVWMSGFTVQRQMWGAAYGTLFVTCVDLQCRDRCWRAACGTLFVTCVDEWVYSAETDAGVLHMEHCLSHGWMSGFTVQRQMLVCCMWNIVCHMCAWVGLQYSAAHTLYNNVCDFM